MKARLFPIGIMLLLSIVLGCGEKPPHNIAQLAMDIESGDECHLCGMLIGHFPGPKGELYSRGEKAIKKFCSTRDLFAYLLQPENTHRINKVFVHDMTVSPWDVPDDKAFIDATKAHYVVGHTQRGAMGPTFASFSQMADATLYQQKFGGRVITFTDINLDLMSAQTSGIAYRAAE